MLKQHLVSYRIVSYRMIKRCLRCRQVPTTAVNALRSSYRRLDDSGRVVCSPSTAAAATRATDHGDDAAAAAGGGGGGGGGRHDDVRRPHHAAREPRLVPAQQVTYYADHFSVLAREFVFQFSCSLG